MSLRTYNTGTGELEPCKGLKNLVLHQYNENFPRHKNAKEFYCKTEAGLLLVTEPTGECYVMQDDW